MTRNTFFFITSYHFLLSNHHIPFQFPQLGDTGMNSFGQHKTSKNGRTNNSHEVFSLQRGFFSLTAFFPLIHESQTNTLNSHMNITRKRQGMEELKELLSQGDNNAKKEMARRLLEEDGVDKDDAKAVSLLEDCVAHDDADAMVMLAKCCALGRGMEHNAERAEVLVSEAAKKGNDEARILTKLINDWKGKETIDLKSL